VSVEIIQGDCRETLKLLPECSVQCCVTSPPYFGLRRYLKPGHPDAVKEIGQEATPELYVAALVDVFREVRRVLKDDGTLWLNIGDSYAAGKTGRSDDGSGDPTSTLGPKRDGNPGNSGMGPVSQRKAPPGYKPKDLIGIPWLVAFALRADGWWLRQDIIWAKPNPMPESVTDRCTKAHEYIFLLTKSPTYFYDAAAICEPSSGWNGSSFTDDRDVKTKRGLGLGPRNIDGNMSANGVGRTTEGLNLKTAEEKTGPTRNKRSVWTVATNPYSEAHFATFPPDLIKPCVLAGSRPGDTVGDPFGGSGTTALVATELGRNAVICELNEEYIPMAKDRTNVTGGLAL